MIVFIEHPVFTKQIAELMTDEQYRDFQNDLAENPHQGDVIPGLGGLRKVRLALPVRGKRGGARALYLLFIRAEVIYLIFAYTKGEFAEIPAEKRKVMKQLVTEIKKEFAQ